MPGEGSKEITPTALEPFFAKWEDQLARQGQPLGGPPNHINNPKIPLKHFAKYGAQVWPPRDLPLPPAVEQGLTRAAESDEEA